MNKVVCNLCGTSYPENATQCPICGYARSAENTASGNSGDGTYTYVKGGRFSKANVKKRNQAAGVSKESVVVAEPMPAKKKSGKGLTIVVIVLLLAIIAVLGYIALRFFLPNNFLFEGTDNLKLPSSVTESEETESSSADTQPVETEPDLSCSEITISQTQIQFVAVGTEVTLTVETEPADTTDLLTFSSSDTSVATVSEDGVVKSTGEGTAVITVTCGAVTAQCNVTCTLPTEPEVVLELNRKEITFDAEGQSWLLYDGEIPVADIVWSSDDAAVATIENGKVVAVANGDTTVYGAYDGQTVSCIIHCSFDEDGAGESGNISEASGDSKRTYTLYNPTGYSDDVTLNVGDKFTLKLVDENKNKIEDAEWEIKDSEIISYEDDIVKALKVGTTKITATYEGNTYTCLVRVI